MMVRDQWLVALKVLLLEYQQSTNLLFTLTASPMRWTSVMRIINVKYVKEMFDNCKVIPEFFNNSPKRYELFSTILKQTVPDATTSTKLINICRTRSVERSKGIQRFKE